jgi:hypothetical protein
MEDHIVTVEELAMSKTDENLQNAINGEARHG